MPANDLSSSPERRSVAAVSFLVLAFFLFKLAPTQADPDLWGHIRFGGDLLETGQFARPDVYSYASGLVRWINHELLAEVSFHLAWTLGGGTGLVLLKTLVGMLVAAGLWHHLLRARLPAVRAGIVLLVASFALFPTLATVRPQMYTVLFFGLLMLILHEGEHSRPRLLWLLPPLLAVWINFHGGVLAGLALVVVYAGAGVISRLARRDAVPIRYWLLPPACAAALVLNPFGTALPEFLLRTATVARPEITEWAVLDIVSPIGISYGLLLLGTGAAIVRRPDRTTPELIAVYCAAALAPLTAERHAALFALAAIVVGAAPLSAAWSDWRNGVTDASPGLFDRAIGRWTLLAAGMLFVALALPHFRRVVMGPSFVYPAQAVERLERSGVRAKLALDFNWGQYALWHLYPEIRVAPDGRRETVYDEATYGRYLAFDFGAGDWDAFLESPPADLALVPVDSPSANLLALDEEWIELHDDRVAVLYARAGFEGVRAIRETEPRDIPANGTGLVFPGP